MENYEEKHESNTQIIKKMAKTILKENKGKEIYLKDIRRFISEQLHREFSPGMYSSAMRDLIDEENGKIVNIGRGVYMYVDNLKKSEINRALDECIESLKSAAYVDFLNLKQEELDYIQEIPNLIKKLESMKFK